MYSSISSTFVPETGMQGPSSTILSSRILDENGVPLIKSVQGEGPSRVVAGNPGDDLMDVGEDEALEWTNSPIHREEHVAHLPTPQSPNSIEAYVNIRAFDSPTRASSRNSRMSTSVTRAQAVETSVSTEVLSSLITPESSPLFIRRPKSSMTSSSSSLPSTPVRKPQAISVTESFHALVSPSHPSTPSTPLSTNISIPSVLSSPFVDRVGRHTSNKVSSPSPGSDAPISDSLDARLPSTPPSLPAPIPQRIAGGEITRLRLQMAAEQAALLEETESRRPEYLKRAKRPYPEIEEDTITGDQQNTAPSLGVVDSPVKGRRIALFQETSEESFEQSLLAGGYPSYGLTPAYAEPSTPQAKGKSTLSQRAIDWLHQATPGQQPHPSTPSANDEHETVETEHEARKRRRLSAFKDHNASELRPKLHPIEVEGHGRVLIDQTPEELPLQPPETPPKKRSNARRRRGGVHDSPSRKRVQLPDPNDDAESGRPNWLDQAFPWSMRLQEREERAHREEEQKLQLIERYLERESDEGEEEDQSLGLPTEDYVEPPARGGRGKMVPLPTYRQDSRRNSSKHNKAYFPSDPADARAALLSKRSVRALAFRRLKEQEEVVCVCRGRDDGRELVQCDDCKEWFHLECIGIHDISELGKEEDPWYCRNCLGLPPARSSSPTFVPTDQPSARPRRDPLFYQGNAQESPSAIPWHMPRIPRTPNRAKDVPQLSSRESWYDSSSPVGPQTPSPTHKSVRSFETLKAMAPVDELFDPMATPSRGMHFSGPFTTPKPSTFWATHAASLQTPSRPTKKPTAPWAFDMPREDSSPYRPVYDDSPVRRSQPRPDKHVAAAHLVPESPLAMRSRSPFGKHR